MLAGRVARFFGFICILLAAISVALLVLVGGPGSYIGATIAQCVYYAVLGSVLFIAGKRISIPKNPEAGKYIKIIFIWGLIGLAFSVLDFNVGAALFQLLFLWYFYSGLRSVRSLLQIPEYRAQLVPVSYRFTSTHWIVLLSVGIVAFVAMLLLSIQASRDTRALLEQFSNESVRVEK